LEATPGIEPHLVNPINFTMSKESYSVWHFGKLRIQYVHLELIELHDSSMFG